MASPTSPASPPLAAPVAALFLAAQAILFAHAAPLLVANVSTLAQVPSASPWGLAITGPACGRPVLFIAVGREVHAMPPDAAAPPVAVLKEAAYSKRHNETTYTFGVLSGLAVAERARGCALLIADKSSNALWEAPLVGGVPGEAALLAGTPGDAGMRAGPTRTTGALFNAPFGLAVDSRSQFVYVADSGNHVVRRVALSEEIGVVDVVTPADSGLLNPRGLALHAPSGSLYVADAAKNSIYAVGLSTGEARVLAGCGAAGAADGRGTAACFGAPEGLALDAEGGALLVSDSGNALVRHLDLRSGVVSTLAGAAGSRGAVEGVGSAARLSRPAGVCVHEGDVLLADYGSRRLLRLTPAEQEEEDGGEKGAGGKGRGGWGAQAAAVGLSLFVLTAFALPAAAGAERQPLLPSTAPASQSRRTMPRGASPARAVPGHSAGPAPPAPASAAALHPPPSPSADPPGPAAAAPAAPPLAVAPPTAGASDPQPAAPRPGAGARTPAGSPRRVREEVTAARVPIPPVITSLGCRAALLNSSQLAGRDQEAGSETAHDDPRPAPAPAAPAQDAGVQLGPPS
eukprot:tig00000828_g4622.t1